MSPENLVLAGKLDNQTSTSRYDQAQHPSALLKDNLVENIDRLKLDVETIIPIHYPADSRKVTVAELNRAVGKKD